MNRLVLVILCLTTVFATTASAESPAGNSDASAVANETFLTPEQIAADVLATMDRTADPCQDFYRYACGTWLDNTELPADRPQWLRSFNTIIERNQQVQRELIEKAAADPSGDKASRLVGTYYGACMDEAAVENAGVEPLRPIFAKIDAITDSESLFAVTGELYRQGIGPFYGFGSSRDYKKPDYHVAALVQGGLGLPDMDYYVSEDDTKRELLAEYEEHVARMFTLLGEDEKTAEKKASRIVAFETELARNSRTKTEMRQSDQLYHRMDRSGLNELASDLPWDAFFKAVKYPETDDFNVMTPEFFEALQDLVATTDLDVLRTYLKWNVVNATAHRLPAAFVDADFEFNAKKLRGQQEIRPRWKRCVAATSGALGEPLGRLYVDRMFAGDSKDMALEMIADIFTAFDDNLASVEWLDDATRWRAHRKLVAVRSKIGYPDRWRDYSGLDLTPDSYFANAVAVAEFDFDFDTEKIGEPVDKDEWFWPPQTVNAGYLPTGNEINFPAGILQPPIFHRDFPAAMNYGSIGLAIGHELTHGFDDQGRKFDPTGKMDEWWEPDVSERYEKQAECVAGFYNAYEVEPGVHVNGELTLGENIADIGGIKLAHHAYRLWQDRHGVPEPLVEGLTNEQLFWVAAGQTWCTVVSPEYLREQVTTDPHTPAMYRVYGPLSNLDGFAEAFECEPGTPMNPKEKCEVW
jgi:predicted metalloendopeptidase